MGAGHNNVDGRPTIRLRNQPKHLSHSNEARTVIDYDKAITLSVDSRCEYIIDRSIDESINHILFARKKYLIHL